MTMHVRKTPAGFAVIETQDRGELILRTLPTRSEAEDFLSQLEPTPKKRKSA